MPWKEQTDTSKLQGTKHYENYQKRGTLPGVKEELILS